MELPQFFYYRKIDIPIDKLIAYYNDCLKGCSNIPFGGDAIEISNKIDSYIDDPNNNFLFYVDLSNKLAQNVFKKQNLERTDVRYVHLKTKLICAEIINRSITIQKYQNEIDKKASRKDYARPNTYTLHYDAVPKESYLSIYSYIKENHRWIVGTKKYQIVEEDFKKNILPLFTNPVYEYCTIFRIDTTPIETKIEETSFNCLGHILMYGSILGLIALMAKCACS